MSSDHTYPVLSCKAKAELRDRSLSSGTALAEGYALRWEESLSGLLHQAGFEMKDATNLPESAPWKTLVAAAMKSKTTVTNRWLAEQLHMGSLHEVSRRINAWYRNPDRDFERSIGITTNHKA